jgi:hypothetical protein
VDRFREFLAGLVLHIIRVRLETAGMFADAPDALRVLQVLAGEGDAGLPEPRSAGLIRRSRSAGTVGNRAAAVTLPAHSGRALSAASSEVRRR